MMGDVKTSNTSAAVSKKEYSSPLLQDYGSVSDLTLGGQYRGSDGQICNAGNDSNNPQNTCGS
jgi:hypothetical protein